MRIDVGLTGMLATVATRAQALARTGVDGLFTFEGNSDVFLPLVHAAALAGDDSVDIYTNVAIAFPRSPMHLAYQAWDLQRASDGRFALGLGTQIKPHIERRFSATWDRPVERMVELIDVIRAIWSNWADGEPLDHRGDFYRCDLMTPLFVPPPLETPRPEIWVGALGPRMTRAMAGAADGILVHPFNTGSLLRARTVPMIEEGLSAAGKTRAELTLDVGCIAAPCLTEQELEEASTAMRYNLAFYGSTPAYRVTLDHHGLGELQPRLREITKAGDWSTLGDLIDDEVLDLLAVRGTPTEVAARLVEEYGGTADRLSLTVAGGGDEGLAALTAEISARVTSGARPDGP